ncbi:MAG: glycosyltransferase family 4 protein [Candidatus Humimicrobiaceae bacterium]
MKILFSNFDYNIIISSSDFLPDVLYSFLIKLKNPKIKWVASYFLDAPKPWARNNPYKVNIIRFFIGLIYWFTQRFSKYFVKVKADIVLVTSEPDVKKFITKKRQVNNIIVVQGGVDTSHAIDYLKSKKVIPIKERKYDACFLGRLHYQKGILEIVDIWKNVCRKKPFAKLAIIGNGPLELELREKVTKNNLCSNIDILGFLTGQNKFEIFKQSKIILHPAIYDSGGMSAAEAMAWGMPGVCFDLESLKTYYPKGMIKTECFNLKKFADNILLLLNNKELYAKLSKEALDLILKNWDWNKKACFIYNNII